MELLETIRGTGSVREFTDDRVADEVVIRILDHARFAPNGGNRQAWKVVVLQDPVVRDAMRELYEGPWRDYFAQSAAGASIYPFMWNIMLAARSEGLGGVITTMHNRVEPEVRALLHVPENLALAGVMMLGHPVHQPTKLRRQPVEAFTTIDRIDGPSFGTRS